MPRPRLLALSLTAALACGDDSEPAVDFAEVCGHAGPVRLLGLPPGRQLQSFSVPFVGDGRRYFRTSDGSASTPTTLGDSDTEAWSTGPCGESPRRLAADVAWLSPLGDRWPGSVFVCEATSDAITRIDPDGGPGTPFLPRVRCGDNFTDHGVIAINDDKDSDTGDPPPFTTLVLHPYPSDPADPPDLPILLHPQLRLQPAIPDPSIAKNALLRRRADEVLGLDAEDNLLSFDLASGRVTVEARDAVAFRVSGDGRYLLWQHLTAPGDDPEYSESAVILQDRSTGEGVALGATALSYSPDALNYVDQGVLLLTLDGGRTRRVFRLPDLSGVDLPRSQRFEAVLDDTHLLVSSLRFATVSILATDTGELTPLLARQGSVVALDSDRALVLGQADYREPPRGPLYDLPFATGDSHIAAQRATQYARLLAPNRLVTPVDLDSRGRGPLLLVDLDTAEERRIDAPVPAASFRLDAGFGPRHVVYSVADGERTGIYVARLPAE